MFFTAPPLTTFMIIQVGLSGLEPLTPALSAQCSNRLSYRPLSQPFQLMFAHELLSIRDYQ